MLAEKGKAMNCFAEKPQNIESESPYHLGLIYAIAWATTDEALLPQLSEAIGTWLKAERTQLVITRWDGTVLHDHVYQSLSSSQRMIANDKPLLRLERSLGRLLTLSITLHGNYAGDDACQYTQCFECIFDLLHTALECLFVSQNDRKSLGLPFSSLADREWQVCQALEGSDTEKLIAHQLGWSSHTLHSYVKGIYRKIGVQSRLEVVRKLRLARLRTRREAFEILARYGQSDTAL
jgi:DNA-binding CsgD family transcriptional regulator